ncbi:uncharacterized protein Dwil_GK22952 [Drosophila willistoni]|uniref:PX domain-containing protein n=1 Tax=Drosophila willistoni TaxID=7260 RepID=B4NN53_DROWI|nr:sorting nexin-16 [Drosophila willistoni]EDW85792.1 uncharacterized protein Dwil_GK22952 [Drosophila willistoni]
MSLRALKKRELGPGYQSNSALIAPTTTNATSTLFKKASSTTTTTSSKRSLPRSLTRTKATNLAIHRETIIVGRRTHSCPDLRQRHSIRVNNKNLLRSKSEGDVGNFLQNNSGNLLTAANAKSEVCLQRISSHTYESSAIPNPSVVTMLGARSHRDLTQSSYGADANAGSRQERRMSECSSLAYSQATSGGGRTSSIFASQMTLSSGITAASPINPNAPLRVPIIGYEVMEERARFTVYKLRVENPETNDCWLVMRRYTDFVRLNGKLKQAFPLISLSLPRKKLFGDNFNSVFLDNRVQGLQIFVNSVMAKEEFRKCKLVREFFCLDEPPSYSESMEECRAIFEAQEETIAHLKLQIQNKNDLILSLQQKLREEINEKEQLRQVVKDLNCDK